MTELAASSLYSPAAHTVPVAAHPLADVRDHSRVAGWGLAGVDAIVILTLGLLFSGLLVLPVLLATNAISGLYPGFGLMGATRLRRRWLLGGAALVLLALACHSQPQWLPGLALTGCLSLALTPLTEDLARLLLAQGKRWGKPVRIMAADRQLNESIRTLTQNWPLGLTPLSPEQSDTLARALVLTPGVLVSPETPRVREIYLLGEGGHIHRVRPEPTPVGWVHPRLHTLITPVQRQMKRMIDLSVGLLALLLSLPLALLTAGAIYLADPGPVLFSHYRRGQYGKPVRIWKLRSMYLDSETRLTRLLTQDPLAASEWAEKHKLSRDPRVLPYIGHFIRRHSIDELPQLWAVVTGELSLVGPRVFLDYDLAIYTANELALRQSVPPGLTGLWQVTIRSHGTNSDKVRYDLAYVRYWSIWMDLDILYRTLGVVIGGRGAF